MIRIEEFLFFENVEESQSENLISKYRNLSFETRQQFNDFFQSQGIRLLKKKQTEQSNSQIVLERMKNFKSSVDYDYVKKYIIRQKAIADAIRTENLESATNEFDAISSEEIDPFFGFVVRKILTGEENGVLPSEQYKKILDDELKRQQEEYDYSVASGEISRDEFGKIVSFKNYLRNTGRLTVPIIDERYSTKTFDYVIDKNFTQIPEAVDAEAFVLKKAEEWATDISITADEAILLEKLKELINEDSTSLPALEAKVEKLQIQLQDAESVQQSLQDTNDNLVEAIDQLSNEFNSKVAETETKDEAISILNETIDKTLTDLGASVTSQIENTADAFDALSAKLEEQAKRAEEQSKAQLDTFKDAINKIVSAVTGSTQQNNSGQSGGGTGSGTNNSSGGTTGQSGNVNKDILPDVKEKRIREEIISAINGTKITLESLEQVKEFLGLTLVLPDETLSRSKRPEDVREYTRLLRDVKSSLINAINKVPSNDDEVLLNIWTDLRDTGLIISSTSGTSGTSGGSKSTSGSSGTGGRGGGTSPGKQIL